MLHIVFLLLKTRKMTIEQSNIRWIQTENVKWFCLTSNSWQEFEEHRNNKLVLFLHGTGGSYECWDEISKGLSRSFVTLCLDLPGHGKSENSTQFKLSLRNIAIELSQLLKLLNIKKLKTIVGHSAGSTLAIELSDYNKQIEVEKIIGINPSLVPPPFHFTMALSPLISPFITSETSVSWLSKIINNSTIIEKLLDSTGSNLKDPIKRDRYARLFNNKKHLKGALKFMAETNVMRVLQNVHSAKTKFLFIIGTKDNWVRPDNLKNIFSKYFPQAKILELDGGHLLNETHAKELCKLILQELTYRGNSI